MTAVARHLVCGVIAVSGAAFSHTSSAQGYPNHSIRLVLPFAPGGSTDTLGRIIGQRLSESVGQPVIIDNRPSAGGTAERISSRRRRPMAIRWSLDR